MCCVPRIYAVFNARTAATNSMLCAAHTVFRRKAHPKNQVSHNYAFNAPPPPLMAEVLIRNKHRLCLRIMCVRHVYGYSTHSSIYIIHVYIPIDGRLRFDELSTTLGAAAHSLHPRDPEINAAHARLFVCFVSEQNRRNLRPFNRGKRIHTHNSQARNDMRRCMTTTTHRYTYIYIYVLRAYAARTVYMLWAPNAEQKYKTHTRHTRAHQTMHKEVGTSFCFFSARNESR